jgi:purine-binding chemotaxis protein CheW
MRQFATFKLDENLYGIDVLLVREINRNIEITPVHPAPEHITGLINLRGQIVTVINLKKRLKMPSTEMNGKPACIILKTMKELERQRSEGLVSIKTAKDICGLLVDSIGDMVSINENDVKKAPSNVHGIDSEYVEGVVMMDNNLMVPLNIEKIVSI